MSATTRRKRILLVDDEREVRALEGQILIAAGYAVAEADDGAAAWEARETFDLVITDHKMPRVTGLELIEMIWAKKMALPVILVSGLLPVEAIERQPWLCPEAMLTKPFTIRELLASVQIILEGKVSPVLGLDQAGRDRLILPRGEAGETPKAAAAARALRILVVDDDTSVRELNIGLLTGTGYRAEGAKDGAAGWAALQAEAYDLVITDNKMPNMTGVEMIEKVREARIAVRLIMATAILPTRESERRPWLTPDAMLQRPFSNEVLLETVARTLRGAMEAG